MENIFKWTPLNRSQNFSFQVNEFFKALRMILIACLLHCKIDNYCQTTEKYLLNINRWNVYINFSCVLLVEGYVHSEEIILMNKHHHHDGHHG